MKKTINSYLSQLKFDQSLNLMKITAYLTNVRIVALLVIGIIIFGLFSFTSLPRRLNPEIQIPIVSVITTFPGAGPSEIEELITIPLEKKLSNSKNMQTISSSSLDNVSIITIEFASSVSVDDARQEVQKQVALVNNLPEDSFDPIVRELDFEDVPVWEFILTSNGSRATLEKAANILKDELETNGKIDRLVISGIEEKEIQILLDPQKIADYNITPIQLAGIINSSTKAIPAGKVKTDNNTYTLSLGTTIDSIDEIRNIPLNINGVQILLSDIADVQYKSALDQKRSYVTYNQAHNQSAVTISVYKTSSADISASQKEAAEITNRVISSFDGVVEVIDLNNVADDINEQFSELYSNFASTIFLVFATLFIFLGLKQATIASLSIPLTFLISLTSMKLTGQTLNFLTLFSLLLGLGLLVDDAIVIISAMTTYYKTGKFTPKETGLLVWKDFLVPIWTTTITTVWAFVPLLLSSGIIGEFIKPIPVVVSSTLLASTTVAVLITLPLMMMLLKLEVPRRVQIFFKVLVGIIGFIVLKNLTDGQPMALPIMLIIIVIIGLILRWKKELKNKLPKNLIKKSAQVKNLSSGGIISMEKVSQKYKIFINKILKSKQNKRKVIASVIIISIFSYALLPLGFVVNEFFPGADTNLIYVTLELPTGTTLTKTEAKSLEIATALQEIEEVEMINTEMGKANRSSSQSSSNGDNLAAISIRLVPTEERDRSSDDISNHVTKIISGFDINSRVYTESGGPPAGSDITIKIIGKDLAVLQSIADTVEDKINQIEGTKNTNRSIKQGNSKIVFKPNATKLSEYGLTAQDLSLWLRTAVSGFELSEVDFDLSEDETKVKLYMFDQLLSPEEISQISILSRSGPVPLLELGELILEPTPSVITRENGNRTLTVTGDISEGFNAGLINKIILDYAKNLDIPVEYEFATGGANEENQKSVESIMQAMILSLILIIATMVIQLGSFRQSLIVILVIPLAISGVFIMFALTNTPLSFPALIGVLALFGIVVNNSIMVVDKINLNIKIGMEQLDAITDATASRLEPIFLSSLTTIIGLLPITLSDPLWRGLGGAIISGLMFSGTVMLLIIPVVYTYFFPQTNK